MRNDPKTIALYIDCENISYKRLDQIIEQLSSYGEIIIRRAYGNWQKEVLKGWSKELQNHAVRRIHHDEYVTGKNASDIDMTIEITETLLTKNIDIFALATSDSDFTPLVTKLREHGKTVLCFGESKATQLFKKICSNFVCLDTDQEKKTRRELRQDTKLVNILRNAFDEVKKENSQAGFLSFEANLTRSGFSAVTFGYEKLSDLLKEIDLFEIDVKKGLHNAILWDKRVQNHG